MRHIDGKNRQQTKKGVGRLCGRPLAVLAAAVLLAGLMGCADTATPDGADASAEEGDKTAAGEEALSDTDGLTGWALVSGEGVQTTTGGGDLSPQTVTTIQELMTLAAGNEPRVLVIEGTLTCENREMVEVGSNKTIVGADAEATLVGGFVLDKSGNVIIRNLNIDSTKSKSGATDGIAVRQSHHLWFDHLSIKNASDGLLDVTLGSDYVTVSWCRFSYETSAYEHRLACLIGSGTGHDEEDMGKLHVTYHHNWFAENCDQRMPRILYGQGHVYNNYYSCRGNQYCVGVGSYGAALIENNYFDGSNNPHQFMYDTALPASITAAGNIYNNTTGDEDNGPGGVTLGYVEPFAEAPYEYTLDDAAEVPEIVKSGAGPQNPDGSAAEEETKERTQDDYPITYDETTKTYTFHGNNSDRTHASYEIQNPFAGLALSESTGEGRPAWKSGVTVSYWVKLATGVTDAAVLNFNLEGSRRISNMDEWKYDACQAYDESDENYALGEQSTYLDAAGNAYTVLDGAGRYVCFNPDYPSEGAYRIDDVNGITRAYKKGADWEDKDNWVYLTYLGDAQYAGYHARFDEEGGEDSLISEGNVNGSLSLYASGSVGFREDDGTAAELNPNLPGYGRPVQIQVYNQFYYWGSGGRYSLKGSDLMTPTMAEKNEWHFVVAVIQNDMVQYYMDGEEMTVEYLNWWGKTADDENVAGAAFNSGYGARLHYRTQSPAKIYTTGRSILDLITDENTKLYVGGEGYAAKCLGQDDIGTPSGVEIRELQFYDTVIPKEEIKADGIISDAVPLAAGAQPE